MIRLLRYITRVFRRRPVVVNTYKVRRSNAEQKRRETTAQLAREMGMPNPLRGA